MVDAESPPCRRRAILVALLVLLMILLPLYLWPLRGALSGMPGASWLPGWPSDPRNPAALARIPSEVWDALMGRAGAPAALPAAKPSRNLTMISQFEETPAGDLPSSLAHEVIAGPGTPERSGWKSGGDDSPPTPVRWRASQGADGPGTGNPWPGFDPGGYPGFGDLGPWNGGGPGGGPRVTSPPTHDPGGSGAPTPTPEPATIILVGSNLALLGAAAWKRRRRRQETPPIG